jgi:hypothetical protein
VGERGRVGFLIIGHEVLEIVSGPESDSNVFMLDVVHALRRLENRPEDALYKEEIATRDDTPCIQVWRGMIRSNGITFRIFAHY